VITRRNAVNALFGCTVSAAAKPIVEANRLSVLSDEVAPDLPGAIRFAKTFELKWLELRGQGSTKRNYYHAPLDEVRESAKMLADAGIGVSFLNTRFLKWHYPGTEKEAIPFPELFEAYKRYNLSPQKLLDDMTSELPGSFERAHILGTTKIRIFSFVRMPHPLGFLPRVADVLGPMAETAHRAGCQLLVENEHTTNVVTGQEMQRIMSLVPSPGVALNWDPHNGLAFESPYPEGYSKLPKARIQNVQIKARSLLIAEDRMDWAKAAADLQRDGYLGCYGLEPHMGQGTEGLSNAKRAMEKLRQTFGLDSLYQPRVQLKIGEHRGHRG
jgi:L-ribulose-5-phosphate 3-epimerase